MPQADHLRRTGRTLPLQNPSILNDAEVAKGNFAPMEKEGDARLPRPN
jgi:hypothetical protein